MCTCWVRALGRAPKALPGPPVHPEPVPWTPAPHTRAWLPAWQSGGLVRQISRRPHGPAFPGVPCALPPPRGHLRRGLPLGPPPRAAEGRGCLGRKTGSPARGRLWQGPGCQESPARRSPGRCLGSSGAQGHGHWAEPQWRPGPQISDLRAGGGFAVFPGPPNPLHWRSAGAAFQAGVSSTSQKQPQTLRKEQEATSSRPGTPTAPPARPAEPDLT